MSRIESFFWLVGLCEGEAYFGFEKYNDMPTLALDMTDEAVIARAAELLGVTYWLSRRGSSDGNHRPTYRCTLKGRRALHVMLRMAPHLSPRRQAAIRNVERRFRQTRKATSKALEEVVMSADPYSFHILTDETA